MIITVGRRAVPRNVGIKDPSAETTSETNLRIRPAVGEPSLRQRPQIVSQQAAEQVNNLARFRVAWRKDPLLESTFQTRITAFRGVHQSDLAIRARQTTALQVDSWLRRQGYAWRKDPATETTSETNLRIRQPLGVLPANAQARQRTESGKTVFRLLARQRWAWRKDPSKETTSEANLHIRRAVADLLTANGRRRQASDSGRISAWIARQNAWFAPTNVVVGVPEVYLTLRTRARTMTVNARSGLTLKIRSRNFWRQTFGNHRKIW